MFMKEIPQNKFKIQKFTNRKFLMGSLPDDCLRLNLWNNNIGHEGAAALAGALKTNTTLTTLNLLENNIGHEGAAALAGALKTNAALTTLILSWNNNIGDEGAAALAGALKTNTALTTLGLEWNNIGDEGAAALAGALKTNRNPTSDEFRAKCRAKGWYYLSAASHACVRGSPLPLEQKQTRRQR